MQSINKSFQKRPDSVKVCIRMRPLLSHEDAEFWQVDDITNKIFTKNAIDNHSDLLTTYSNSITNHTNKDIKRALMDSLFSPQCFTFDRVYPITANSQIIYKEICRDISKSVIKGYNGSIFMYGQTTSGKTYTMLGSPNSPGILPCTLRDIFNLIQKEPNPESYAIYCSYVEIYNENIHDLLTDSNFLKLIDDNKYGVVVAGAKRVRINTFEDGIGIKDFGEENRKYRETLINEYSSRSHTIFQIFIESEEVLQNEENVEYAKSRFSCLNLIDLAGSERISEYDPKTENSGETGYINKSLFVLANVINRLAESKGNKQYIPYRDSKLTRLLSQALGGNSLTAIICTVSPAALNYYQTLSTLRFAMRAKNVKLKPTANEYLDDKAKLEYYKSEIKKLKNELKTRAGSNSNTLVVNRNNDPPEEQYDNNENMELGPRNNSSSSGIQKILKENASLNTELNRLKELYQSEKQRSESYKEELNKIKSIDSTPINYGTANVSMNNPNSNDSIFIDNLILQLSPSNSNNVSIHKSNNQWKEETNKISNEYKNQLLSLQNQYSNKVKNLHKEIFDNKDSYANTGNNSANISNMLMQNTMNRNSANTVSANLIETELLESPKIENNEYIMRNNNSGYNPAEKDAFNATNNSNNNLRAKRNKYDNNLIYNLSSNNNDTNNQISSSKELITNENDIIIQKIASGKIFDSINLQYIPRNYEHFEENVKYLKENYENKLDALEKTMDYYKSYIENYYRKKIQKTRYSNIDAMQGNLPIMQITDEHNDMLKKLRELNDDKIKELETSFFTTLRSITAKRMEDITK